MVLGWHQIIDKLKTQKVEATSDHARIQTRCFNIATANRKGYYYTGGRTVVSDRLSENINLNLHILGMNDALALAVRLASASASVAPQVPFRSASSPAADVPWAAHLR